MSSFSRKLVTERLKWRRAGIRGRAPTTPGRSLRFILSSSAGTGVDVLPRSGDVLRVTRAASVQFATPMLFRVIRVHDWSTYNGWAWLDGYELNGVGDAVERRSIFVQLDGLLPAQPGPGNPAPNRYRPVPGRGNAVPTRGRETATANPTRSVTPPARPSWPAGWPRRR